MGQEQQFVYFGFHSFSLERMHGWFGTFFRLALLIISLSAFARPLLRMFCSEIGGHLHGAPPSPLLMHAQRFSSCSMFLNVTLDSCVPMPQPIVFLNHKIAKLHDLTIPPLNLFGS